MLVCRHFLFLFLRIQLAQRILYIAFYLPVEFHVKEQDLPAKCLEKKVFPLKIILSL